MCNKAFTVPRAIVKHVSIKKKKSVYPFIALNCLFKQNMRVIVCILPFHVIFVLAFMYDFSFSSFIFCAIVLS